jgi:hypothetical protein
MQHHQHITLDRLDHAAAVDREAARLLLRLIWRLHVVTVTEHRARIEADIPLSVLDRLAIWGSHSEDLKPEPWEDDGDLEEDRGAA